MFMLQASANNVVKDGREPFHVLGQWHVPDEALHCRRSSHAWTDAGWRRRVCQTDTVRGVGCPASSGASFMAQTLHVCHICIHWGSLGGIIHTWSVWVGLYVLPAAATCGRACVAHTTGWSLGEHRRCKMHLGCLKRCRALRAQTWDHHGLSLVCGMSCGKFMQFVVRSKCSFFVLVFPSLLEIGRQRHLEAVYSEGRLPLITVPRCQQIFLLAVGLQGNLPVKNCSYSCTPGGE